MPNNKWQNRHLPSIYINEKPLENVNNYITQSPLPIRIHCFSHLQSLCGGYVNICRYHNQIDGLLLFNERLY